MASLDSSYRASKSRKDADMGGWKQIGTFPQILKRFDNAGRVLSETAVSSLISFDLHYAIKTYKPKRSVAAKNLLDLKKQQLTLL